MTIVRFAISRLPKANLYLRLAFEFLLYWYHHKNHEPFFWSQQAQNFRCESCCKT
jgi:hypothetical protein